MKRARKKPLARFVIEAEVTKTAEAPDGWQIVASRASAHAAHKRMHKLEAISHREYRVRDSEAAR